MGQISPLYITLIVIVIVALVVAFYFYRNYLSTAIMQCPEWDEQIGQLLTEGNYCMSAQECTPVVIETGCCQERKYVSKKFYKIGALKQLVAKYNKHCSSEDICADYDCPANMAKEVVCQNYNCLARE